MSIIVECKKICLRRCLTAVALSIAMQFILLAVFLLCINFHALHPWEWLSETVCVLFSFYTWFAILPLISAVIVYGILLGQSYLAVKKYYRTRFRWLLGTVHRKAAFLLVHVVIGFVTAWLYAGFLHVDYRNFIFDCYSNKCINSRYTFLVCVGIMASCYHFVKENLRNEPELEFPTIQEVRLVKMRSLLYATLYNSLLKSFVPTLSFGFIYWLFGGIVNRCFANIFEVDVDESLQTFFSIAGNARLLFYAWILATQILSNMHLLQRFFSILLAEEIVFPIDKQPVLCSIVEEVTLVDALSMSSVPVMQNLAALDLRNISCSKATIRRQQTFALSIPGGHPYNWNQLSAQSLSLIKSFTAELATSVKNIKAVKSTPLFATVKPLTATDAAQKILLRQYNQTIGIRRMMSEPCPAASTKKMSDVCKRIHDRIEHLKKQIRLMLTKAFVTIPGLFYMFGEPESAKTAFLLSNSQTILWLVQGLAGICTASLTEDKYGVVQVTLPQIIQAMLALKAELDKLNNVNLNGKKLDRNFIALRGAVKRSLYQISTVFRNYLRDLIDDQEDLRKLQCFVSYQEI